MQKTGLKHGLRCKATGKTVVDTVNKHIKQLFPPGRSGKSTHWAVYVMTNEDNEKHLQHVNRAGFKILGDVPAALRKGFLDEELLMIELQLVAMASHFVEKHANTLVYALIKPMRDHIATFSESGSSTPAVSALKLLHEARSTIYSLFINTSLLSA